VHGRGVKSRLAFRCTQKVEMTGSADRLDREQDIGEYRSQGGGPRLWTDKRSRQFLRIGSEAQSWTCPVESHIVHLREAAGYEPEFQERPRLEL
jgi:hypothetical protein